jgi:endonuclease/exonuclease/phosphatase (EEP) superfamily protein YafD
MNSHPHSIIPDSTETRGVAQADAPGTNQDTTEADLPADSTKSQLRRGSKAPDANALFSSFAILVCWLAASLLIFSHLGRFFYFAELLVNFQLQIGIFGLGLVVFMMILSRWKSAGAIGLIVVVTLYNPLSSYLPAWNNSDVGEQRLRVMTYNIYAMNSDQDQMIETITDADPDVLVLVEYMTFNQKLQAYLKQKYPYFVEEPRFHGFGIAMFSRFPMEETSVEFLTQTRILEAQTDQDFDHENKDDPALFAVLDVNGERLLIAGVHFFNPIQYEMYPARNQQMQRLGDVLRRHSELPIVVAGDFNCTPWSHFFRRLIRETGLRDSRQGYGYQGSWPSDSSLIRIPIDQVLVSKEIHVEHRQVGPAGGSDHFSIVSDLSF